MSLDESFKYIPKYSEEEVFELTHRPNQIRVLEPTNFEGPMAEWAKAREQEYGDFILSRTVYSEALFGNPHRVAWIYHESLNLDSNELQTGHHLLCDCIVEVEKEGDTDLMSNCTALKTVLAKRAWLINSKYRMDEVFETFTQDKFEPYDESPIIIELGKRTVMYLLEYDAHHPEGWVANTTSGQHHVNLLGLIMQQPPESVRGYVEILEEADEIELADGIIKLEERKLTEIHEIKAKREKDKVALRRLESEWKDQILAEEEVA